MGRLGNMKRWVIALAFILPILWVSSPFIARWIYTYTHSCYPSELIALRNGYAFYCFDSLEGGAGQPVFCPSWYGLTLGCHKVDAICVKDGYLVPREEAAVCLFSSVDPYYGYKSSLLGIIILAAISYALSIPLAGGRS